LPQSLRESSPQNPLLHVSIGLDGIEVSYDVEDSAPGSCGNAFEVDFKKAFLGMPSGSSLSKMLQPSSQCIEPMM